VANANVWGLWSEADYYGPHLQSIYATESAARHEAQRRHDAECSCEGRHGATGDAATWPYIVIEHEVLT